jgi:hypothetical protein
MPNRSPDSDHPPVPRPLWRFSPAPPVTRVPVLLAFLLLVACGGGKGGADRTAVGAAVPDSTVFGDDRAHAPAKLAPDVALLERLIDDYEALDVVMDRLASTRSRSPVKGHAWSGDRHEDAAKGRLSDLLTAEFHERYQPRTPTDAGASAGTVAALAHPAGKAALDSIVLAQHRRVAEAIAAAAPLLTNARVREALGELAADVRKEIAKLEDRAG